jgi:hypothetical protein
MTVRELKILLDKMPDDAKVFREGGEYNGDYRSISKVDYRLEAKFDQPRNSVLIR